MSEYSFLEDKNLLKIDSLKDLIINGGKEIGFNLIDSQVEKFIIYLSELKKWNKSINLTAIKDDKLIITRLFLESLTFLYCFRPEDTKNVLDIGTGAGFPGMPIKIIHPEIFFTLTEGSKKKVVFLKHICRQIKLSAIECLSERAEEMVRHEKYKRYYDVVLAKGVSDIKTLIKVSFPLLKSGSLFITQKGEDLEGELKDAELELKKGNWRVKNIIEVNKPIFGRAFRLVVIQNLS
ncbi:MAG: 16S rRNA (guanine(527)-N(7))-methyltransferase RsmG [Nitrospinota bacterium]